VGRAATGQEHQARSSDRRERAPAQRTVVGVREVVEHEPKLRNVAHEQGQGVGVRVDQGAQVGRRGPAAWAVVNHDRKDRGQAFTFGVLDQGGAPDPRYRSSRKAMSASQVLWCSSRT